MDFTFKNTSKNTLDVSSIRFVGLCRERIFSDVSIILFAC